MRNLNLVDSLSQKQIYTESVRQECDRVPFEKLDPQQAAIARERIERTLKLLRQHTDPQGLHIADLGCGAGSIALALADSHAQVTAVDAAAALLERWHHPNVVCKQAYIPYLPFNDESFDGLVLTDVIASIEPHLHRPTLSELARLLTREGWLMISTPLDLYSTDADLLFLQLVQTEFEVIATTPSYHRLHFYLSRWIEAPSRFVRASHSSLYRTTQLQKRSGFTRLWFTLNSHPAVAPAWRPLAWLLEKPSKFIKNNRRLLLLAERLSKMLWGNSALTHMIVLARKKKMVYNV